MTAAYGSRNASVIVRTTVGRISSGERTFQTLAEAGNDGVGIVAVAIEEAIHASLYPLSQRLKRNGDDAGSEERQDHPTFGFEQRTHARNDEKYSPATSAVSTV